MGSLDTEEILDGIRRKDDKVLQYIYMESYPVIQKYILANNGNEEDSEDIFQEGIILIYRKVVEDELEIPQGFKSYLNAVCKFLWSRELEKRRPYELGTEPFNEIEDNSPPPGFENPDKTVELRHLIQKHLIEMDPNCQQLLLLFYDDISIADIKQSLGFYSPGYARKMKHLCKKKLTERLMKDPEFRSLMDLD